jgi:putative oxidoreductase
MDPWLGQAERRRDCRSRGQFARQWPPGIRPPIAYIIPANETSAAICLIFWLFTRFWATALAIERADITFGTFFPHRDAAMRPGGMREYPLMWGLITFAIALRAGGPYSVDRAPGVEL